ncbi:SpoIIE family protein phosphatase [Streptomyces achromogenes]|uniref:SpoIIE family protein phosphatase n=1 Tax=Streptomyces achromogenes TaxID=67255 RepID=UPI0004C66163|nr:SpoIIE family protein phosphatase [Streptomyces achromogenes]
MGSPIPPGAPARRLAPSPENVVVARRFVRSVLGGLVPDVVDTAELLTGELVTNAVLHARTGIEVEAWTVEGQAHVRVSDHRPDYGLVPHARHLYASTGRGLALVEELATSHGVHSGRDRKTVWFEVWPEAPAPPASAWETVAPPGRTVTVTLNDVPYALYWAAQQQWEGLLRELFLARSGASWAGVCPEDLAVAQDTSSMICASMTAAVEQETPDSSTLSLRVAFAADATPRITTLRRVLEAADTAAQQESLLALPPLPHIRAFRHWLLDQITGQLSGGQPASWTQVTGAPGANPTDLAPWDASEVESALVPTVAADDTNRIVAVNDAASGLLGWPAHALVGRPLTVLMPEHLRRRHVSAFTSLLLTGASRILGRPIPVPALRQDGRVVPIRLTIQAQEAIDGRTVFVAQLTTTTAPPVPPDAPGDARPATRPVPGPVRLPTTTRKTRTLGTETAAPEWLSLFADTGIALTSTLDPEERLRRVCHVLTRSLADWCMADLVDEQGRLERVCVVHRDPHVSVSGNHLGMIPPPSEITQDSLPRVLRGAGPLLVTDIAPPDDPLSPLDTRQRDLVERLGANSAVVAPLRAERAVFGALTMVRTRAGHPFAKEDVPLIGELVRAVALGVDNARLHQHARSNAEHLQRALLPELPRADHLELAARYVPSSTTAEVGGDWYDAFTLPGGDIVLVIGDVAGHDLQAAVAMSTLRNMLRGIAVDRQEPPEEVLRRLDLASQTLNRQSTATCVYGLVKSDGRTTYLHYSSAGHLPPLLTTEEGATRYLDAGRGLLIGMDPQLPRRSAWELLPPHSTLLFFTDGLIERRGESLDEAMGRLRRSTAAQARAPLDVFCDELVLRFGRDTTDDIALLALRPGPPARPAYDESPDHR